MSEQRLSPDDERVVALCNKLGPILSGHNVAVVLASLSEMIAFGLSTALDTSAEAGVEQHEKARAFVVDFVQSHIKHIAHATDSVITTHLVSSGSETVN